MSVCTYRYINIQNALNIYFIYKYINKYIYEEYWYFNIMSFDLWVWDIFPFIRFDDLFCGTGEQT